MKSLVGLRSPIYRFEEGTIAGVYNMQWDENGNLKQLGVDLGNNEILFLMPYKEDDSYRDTMSEGLKVEYANKTVPNEKFYKLLVDVIKRNVTIGSTKQPILVKKGQEFPIIDVLFGSNGIMQSFIYVKADGSKSRVIRDMTVSIEQHEKDLEKLIRWEN